MQLSRNLFPLKSTSNRARARANIEQAHPLSQVYSFVPIPGAQQHKRPRRRYEEIERMYKCGWNGCEKAYGTLNHLNAHVTMQSHGQKRTPEGMSQILSWWDLFFPPRRKVAFGKVSIENAYRSCPQVEFTFYFPSEDFKLRLHFGLFF
jgi:hypothetical protein